MKMFKTLVFVCLFVPSVSWAALLNFNATGVVGISGFVQFDDVVFDGGVAQLVSNSLITDLSLDFFGEIFTLADVPTSGGTFIDSSGLQARIVTGDGSLAAKPSIAIAFVSDGDGGDGDADLRKLTDATYSVLWVPETALVPIPAAAWLFGSALLGLGVIKRKRV